jgi:polyphosphate kinase
VFYFANGGEEELFASSADWMERNFFRRVELAFPLKDPELFQRVKQEMGYYLADNCRAWLLQPDGSYRRAEPGDGVPFSAQQALLEEFAEG